MTHPDYLALRNKVAQKTAEIVERNSSRVMCKKGCHGCCRSGLSVSPIEFHFISSHLKQKPEILESLTSVLKRDKSDLPQSGESCDFLTSEGSCSIYEARPIICMSHGVPIYAKTADSTVKSVCPLNFTDGLEQLDSSNFLNLDLINSILGLLNETDYPGSEERFPLKPSSFISRS
jgi:Fe-S-cluster containining protein